MQRARFEIETKVCVKCRKLFKYCGAGICYCPICEKISKENCKKIQEYLKTDETISLEELARKMEIQPKEIQLYLKESLIILPEQSPMFIECEGCHKKIHRGRLCFVCNNKMLKIMNELSY